MFVFKAANASVLPQSYRNNLQSKQCIERLRLSVEWNFPKKCYFKRAPGETPSRKPKMNKKTVMELSPEWKKKSKHRRRVALNEYRSEDAFRTETGSFEARDKNRPRHDHCPAVR